MEGIDEITTIIPAFAGARDSFGDYVVYPENTCENTWKM
jgi:hypothetical protein